jgi:hypothetical protein
VAVSPHATPWLAAVGGAVRTHACGLKAVTTGQNLKTPPRCRRHPLLASRAPVLIAPSPVSEADHVIVRAPCLCPSVPPLLFSRLRRREPLHGERSPEHPLATFFSGSLVPELPLPPHPDAGPHRPPEHPPCRRTPPPSRFFHPSHRQEARVSCRLHPLARRVTPPPWMLERPTLPHLRHGSTAAGHTAMPT